MGSFVPYVVVAAALVVIALATLAIRTARRRRAQQSTPLVIGSWLRPRREPGQGARRDGVQLGGIGGKWPQPCCRLDTPRRFFDNVEHQRIISTIDVTERRARGEVCVYLERDLPVGASVDHDAGLARARDVFFDLGLHDTAEPTAALVYLALRPCRFAIVTDVDLAAIAGDEFWTRLRDSLEWRFTGAAFTDGICDSIAQVGEHMRAQHARSSEELKRMADGAPI